MNRNFGKLENGAIQYAPNNVRIGDTIFAAPTAEQYATAGYFAIEDAAPTATEGYYANPTGWKEANGKIVREYELVAIPAAVHQYSKLRLIIAAKKIGKWDALKAWIAAAGYEDEFAACQYISDDYDGFADIKAAVVAAGVLTDAEVATVLAGAMED